MSGKGTKAYLFILLVVLAAVLAWGPVASAQEPILGEIKIFAFNFVPRGFAFCDGQLMPISQNSALFALLGTIYGGDGRTTFALPDLRGRVPMHMGHGPGLTPRSIGQRGGLESVQLTTAQMPAHTHNLYADSRNGDVSDPCDTVWASTRRDRDYSTYAPDVNMAPEAISSTGGNQPHYNMQPYLVVNYSIALVGIFPSRN